MDANSGMTIRTDGTFYNRCLKTSTLSNTVVSKLAITERRKKNDQIIMNLMQVDDNNQFMVQFHEKAQHTVDLV